MSKTLASYDLKEISNGIHGESKYYINNKKVERSEFQNLKDRAISSGVYGPASNAQVNGKWIFYTTVRV